MDRGMSKGSSEKVTTALKSHNVFVRTHLGGGLLHHKCALIDNTFVFGSANWTKAAFSKNEEYLLFLESLSKKDLHEITKFFTYTEKTSM
jgi:phosphatidylserine/phosphatidylglycerophosphate/cardiolipin synthase-like enzyme